MIYSWSCSLRPELFLSGSSRPPLGRQHARETLPPPSSPRDDHLQVDPQETRNVLQEERKTRSVHIGHNKSLTYTINKNCFSYLIKGKKSRWVQS